jgi:hypothetical protein
MKYEEVPLLCSLGYRMKFASSFGEFYKKNDVYNDDFMCNKN